MRYLRYEKKSCDKSILSKAEVMALMDQVEKDFPKSKKFPMAAMYHSSIRGFLWRDLGKTVRALVAAFGHEDTPHGRTIVAVATAASVAPQMATVSTLPEAIALVGAALSVLPVDRRVASILPSLAVLSQVTSAWVEAQPRKTSPRSHP